jgi:predicted Zn-dependent peptidase
MIHYVTLDSGLKVIMEPVEGVVSVSTGLWFRTGSRHETVKQHGYAHFIEHLLFKGTENYSAKELAKIVDRVGGQHNAATNREYTCYYLNLVSDHLELAADVLSEMYYRPLLNKDDIEKEKGIIIEEIRMYEDTPDEFIHDYFTETMFREHPLGHSILGTIDNIQNARQEDLQDFYHTYYNDENAILTIAGNIDVDKTTGMLNRYFSSERPGKGNRTAGSTAAYSVEGYKSHVERDLEQVHFCMGVEGIPRDDSFRWPLYSLSTVLGGSMSSRLFQNIREKEGLSYSIYSFHSSYSDRGLFGMYCATSPDTFFRAVELMMNEVKDIYRKSIDEEEFNDTKSFMKGNLALSYESNDVRMGQLAKNEMTFGRQFTYSEISEAIDKISLDDFQLLSEKLFKEKSFSLVSVGSLKGSGIETLDLNI